MLADLGAGPVHIERLELDVSDLGTDPGATSAERFQRRRTRLRALTARITGTAIDQRVESVRRTLAGLGLTQVQARLNDGYISVRARAADGLAAADLTFRVHLVTAGVQLRALASHIRVHGHLPTPGPVVADRIMATMLGTTDVAGVVDRPHARGLCDVEIDLVGALLWHLMPPAGWRLPAVQEIDLVHVRISRAAVEVAYGPTGSRTGDLGVRPAPLALASAHDLMHSADQQLRSGKFEDAMRGYRALLAAGGPEQPHLLERILALASARPAWFFDGLELARQALGRWPQFPAAHAALASITLAQGDAREAAAHLSQLARLASGDGDDDQAALAALAGARLLRVLEPKSATELYELALEHDPSSAEAADALADRLADEQRWPELVRLLRARAVTADLQRAIELRLRLADVFVHQLGDPNGAQHELEVARELAPDNPAVHEMTATILASSNPPAALEAWRQVARLAETRGDTRSAARALAIVGELLAKRYAAAEVELWEEAETAWRRALELDPLQPEAIAGLATAAAARGAHGAAADLYERLRGLGLPQHIAARYELMLARSLVHLGRIDEARAALRRATLAGGETAAEAHAVLAEIAEASDDREHAAVELDTAISSFVDLVGEGVAPDERLYARAAELAVARATLLESTGHSQQALVDWERAHDLAADHAPAIARDAARTMLDRAPDASSERRWIDAVLATRPPPEERAQLLVSRADVRRREDNPDVASAIADLHEALELTENADIRRRAYQLEAEFLAKSGDQRARAQALTALARLAERSADRVEVETAAAAAWLAADEPAAALPHGARAHAELVPEVSPTLRRDVLTTLGEAAWRQRAWPDVIRAYRGLVDDSGVDESKIGIYRYRLAVAADRTGDANLALDALRPLVDESTDPDAARATPVDIRGQALRLFSDLAERAGDLAGAATALESFAGVALESSPTARADAMYRAGELFRRADRRDDAVRCLEAALRISDTHLPALDALELAWRERNDLERVAVILGRKVAVTGRHPQRQKPLLSRLGDLQDQLGRPDVALATHQRALEIDSTWRPSLAYVTKRLVADNQRVAAAGGLAQLAGDLPTDSGLDAALVVRDRQLAAEALSHLVADLDDSQVESVRSLAEPALLKAAQDPTIDVKAGLARLRGEASDRPTTFSAEENTPGHKLPRSEAAAGALSLRDAATRARQTGKLQDALASLEAANHVSPSDQDVLREIVEVATELGDHESAAKHLALLADLQTGSRKGETLLALADVYYDRIDDSAAARAAMRDAADAFGFGARRDSALRMLASEAASHLAWNIAVDAVAAIEPQRRTGGDIVLFASALMRSGRAGDAVVVVEEATAQGKFEDGGILLAALRAELSRKAGIAANLDERAGQTTGPEADDLRHEASGLWHAIGSVANIPIPRDVGATSTVPVTSAAAQSIDSDRDRLVQAQRDNPDDPDRLVALLAHLGDREPALRREVVERAAQDSHGRAQSIALHELALAARGEHDPIRAAAMWTKAHRVDPSYAPVWMPLADALAGADEIDLARELYEQIAASTEYDEHSRHWARERADALGHDDAVVSGEIKSKPAKAPNLDEARELAENAQFQAAIRIAEAAAEANPADTEALELLEQLYFEAGDITAASEAIGRQLLLFDDPDARARLWRKRAKLYRDALGRDAEAYRCLKEAHACAPADPEIAYQLRTAAMVRGEWALVASLLYREIAASTNARERGALHLELALIFEEKLDDPAQAQVNYEQALAFDPSIPAAKPPLARRYEQIGRHGDAAKLFNEAATGARPADRIVYFQAATRNRALATHSPENNDLVAALDKAETDGNREAALEYAQQLWKADPGHAAAFRVLATEYRNTSDLDAMTEIATVRANKSTNAQDRALGWLEVARLAEEIGKLTDAARAYDLALIEEPRNPGALDARGALAFKLADWPTADVIYRDLDPEESVLGADDLALRRSTIAEQLGRHEEALSFAKQAAQIAPGRSDVMMRVQHLATATGELKTAIGAARAVLDLIPLTDDDLTVRTRHALVELFRMVGNFDEAIAQLELIVRDHPHHAQSIELLAEMHIAKNDWPTATRYLYQLVPLAPSPQDRAHRLYRLGEAVLAHLLDVDRADDIFLRASDLDPSHVPTLRRLLDVYWRADDPGAIVDVASELARTGGLTAGPITGAALGRALVACALVGENNIAKRIADVLGEEAAVRVAAALAELEDRSGRLSLAGASTAVSELSRRGIIDIQKVRQAASGTAAEQALASSSVS